MPWDCGCGTHVERDEGECPSCGKKKAAWTMVADRTRTLVVGRRASPHFRGVSEAPVDRAGGYGALELVEATELVTVEKACVRQLARLGLLPAPSLLFVVRLPAGKAGQVTLVPEFERREVTELAFPTDAAVAGAEGPELRFLLVHGPGALAPELAPAGVHVVDVGEPTPRGWAPSLGVAVVTKRRATLPVTAERRAFVWSS